MYLLPISTLLLLTTTLAFPTPTPTHPGAPTRPFTVAAFLSPYPSGTPGQISGVKMVAQGGTFFLDPNASNSTCANGPYGSSCNGLETVLWVDRRGEALLDSDNPQQVYIDTATGALSFLSPVTTPPNTFLPGALVTDFVHLGQGTVVSVPIPGSANFANVGPGIFQWLGTSSGNPSWFACPRPGQGYQVMKDVGGHEDWSACLSGLQLVALDYGGASPAAKVYS